MTEECSHRRQWHKDDLVTVRIEDIGASGEGIGRADGFTLFIKDAVPGDVVLAKIMKVKKGYGYARLIEVQGPSPCRVPARCPVARPCGGCQIQELDYEQQLVFKERKVREDLLRIGGFSQEKTAAVLRPILGMENPWRFRNKAQFPVGERGGELIAGFYAGRTHHIVPVDDCLIGGPQNRRIVQLVLEYMRHNQVSAYDEQSGKGLVRHILIRNGYHSGEILVCLVVNGLRLPEEGLLVRTLRTVPGIVSISININRDRTNVIMGQQVRILWGKDAMEDSLSVLEVEESELPGSLFQGGKGSAGTVFHSTGRSISYRISPLSFYQVNPGQTERLYSLVRHYAGLTGREVVWDLYCGVGTISCFLAREARTVYGVEIIPDAIRDARENARRNGLKNVIFEVGKAEDILPVYVQEQRRKQGRTGIQDSLLPETDEPAEVLRKGVTGTMGVQDCPLVDVVVVDPPRRGCDEACLRAILEAAPRRIIYVSCDPATMARDLRILTAGGYELCAVQPLDQFAHCVHVETVCLLGKRKPDLDNSRKRENATECILCAECVKACPKDALH